MLRPANPAAINSLQPRGMPVATQARLTAMVDHPNADNPERRILRAVRRAARFAEVAMTVAMAFVGVAFAAGWRKVDAVRALDVVIAASVAALLSLERARH